MSGRGFTLLELLLAIGLLALLTAMAVPLLLGPLARRQLVESAEQLRSLLYLASAEARQQGRRVELRFVDPPEASYLADPDAPTAARGVEVRVERDPLAAPGQFEPLAVDWAGWSVSGRAVQVVRVQVAEAMQIADEEGRWPANAAGGQLPSIIFGCDGRSQVGDVSVVLLNDRLDGCLVRLRASTGLATVEPLAAEPP